MDRTSRIRQFIVDELALGVSLSELTDTYPLIEREAIDSMGILRLVGFIEEEFGVEVEDEDLVVSNFSTVSDITRLIDSKREA